MQTEYQKQIGYAADILREKLHAKIPVDPIRMIENLGGVCEKQEPDHSDMRFRNAYSIIQIKENNLSFAVRYSGQEDDVGTKFSIARELGRVFLYLIEMGDVPTTDVRLDCDPLYSKEEARANEFALALLMPEYEFIDYCTSQGSSVKIEDAAKHFIVSQQSVRIRGRILGLW